MDKIKIIFCFVLTMKLNSMYSNGDTTVIVFEKYSFEKFKKSTIHDFLYVRDTLYCIGEKKIRKLDSKRVVENSKLVNELYFKSCKIFEKNEIVVHRMSYVRKYIKKKLENSSNGQFWNIKRICNEFEKYKLGGKLRVPPDLKIRKTILGKNLFNIKFEGVKWQEHQSQEKD